ncbi:hypothetical protein MTQ10_14080 [Streptomyces sp. XM83C]|jgi:hypothetical protein|uniref:hypothetical protein n=1 Tax=Streptomyces sp. XM83C TaxID=2929781 RepID=UPI001FFC1840|nr:hypothetical protein [Streptomyces sp. XM83C]MCK1820709.1 hypothetical protein [Streptomyces sp. XM83C]
MKPPVPDRHGTLRARIEPADGGLWSGTPIYAGLVREWRARGRTVPARPDTFRLPAVAEAGYSSVAAEAGRPSAVAEAVRPSGAPEAGYASAAADLVRPSGVADPVGSAAASEAVRVPAVQDDPRARRGGDETP